MSDEKLKILEMIASGKITPAEGSTLLDALGKEPAAPAKELPRYLRITVEGHRHRLWRGHSKSEECCKKGDCCAEGCCEGEKCGAECCTAEEGKRQHVNLRVPLSFLRAGVRLAGILPGGVQEHVSRALKHHGFEVDLAKLKGDDLDDLVRQLGDMSIDVDAGKEKVRIFCE